MDEAGRRYQVRVHGTALHQKVGSVQAYLGEDGRIYAYDADSMSLTKHDPSQEGPDVGDWLGAMLADQQYIEAMAALGGKPSSTSAWQEPRQTAVYRSVGAANLATKTVSLCGWPFTQEGGRTRPNCRVPNACADRVARGWLPGIGDPANPHNRGLGPVPTDGTPARVPTVAQAKAAQAKAIADGLLPEHPRPADGDPTD
jgi:hypothetical protein